MLLYRCFSWMLDDISLSGPVQLVGHAPVHDQWFRICETPCLLCTGECHYPDLEKKLHAARAQDVLPGLAAVQQCLSHALHSSMPEMQMAGSEVMCSRDDAMTFRRQTHEKTIQVRSCQAHPFHFFRYTASICCSAQHPVPWMHAIPQAESAALRFGHARLSGFGTRRLSGIQSSVGHAIQILPQIRECAEAMGVLLNDSHSVVRGVCALAEVAMAADTVTAYALPRLALFSIQRTTYPCIIRVRLAAENAADLHGISSSPWHMHQLFCDGNCLHALHTQRDYSSCL